MDRIGGTLLLRIDIRAGGGSINSIHGFAVR